MLIRRRCALFVVAISIAVAGCSKEPSATGSFTLERTEVQALEIVRITLDPELPPANTTAYTATVGEVAAPLVTLDEDELLVLVPDVAPGSTWIALTAQGVEAARPMTVIETPAIADPVSVITTAIDGVAARTATARAGLATLPASADVIGMSADLDTIDVAISNARAALATAEVGERDQVARFLQLNARWLEPDLLGDSLVAPWRAPASTCAEGPRDELCRCIGSGFRTQLLKLVTYVAIGGGLGGAVGSLFSGVGAAFGARIGAVFGVGLALTEFHEWGRRELSLQCLNVAEYVGLSEAMLAGPSLRQGESKQVALEATYRVLAESDAAPEYGVIVDIVAGLERYRSIVELLASTGAVAQRAFALADVSTTPTAVAPASSAYYRVEPGSQTMNGITFTAALQTGTLSLAASGQGATETFTFDIVYENPGVASTRASVSVTVLGSCGDGVVQAGEDCDGSDLGGRSCSNGGYLQCSPDCTIIDNCASGTCLNGQAGYFPGPYEFNYCPNDPGYAWAGVYNSCCDNNCGSGGTCPWAYHCYDPNNEHPCYGSCPGTGPVVWFCLNGDSCAGDGCNAVNGGARCTGSDPFYYSVKYLSCPL